MKDKITESVARNFSIMFVAQMANWVASFVLLMFLPRYLGSEDYGRLYLALSIKMMLGLFIDFGGNFLIPKEVARSEQEGQKILNSYLILRVLLWIISIGGVILVSHWLGYSEHVQLLILILVIGKLWEGGTKAIKAYFQGIERTEYPSIARVVERMFVAAFSVAALLMGADSVAMAVIITIGALLNLLVVLWFSKRFVTFEFNFDTKVFSLLSSGLPYFLFSLFSIIYYRVDAIMLSSMTSEQVTGWYGGAYRFFDAVMVLPIIYKTVIFPIFSKLWDNEDGMLESTFGKSLKLMLILAVPVALGIFLFSKDIIHFFMGLEEYGPAVVVLQIFAISIPVIFVDFIFGSAIMGAANSQRAWAAIGFTTIFLNVGINYLLIPHTQELYGNGGIGAAWATFVTEFFIMSSAIFLLPNTYFDRFKASFVFKPLLAGGCMAAFVWMMSGTGWYWIIILALSGVVYLGALFAVRTFSDEEMKMIKNLGLFTTLKERLLAIRN